MRNAFLLGVYLAAAAGLNCGGTPEQTKNANAANVQATPEIRMVEPAKNVDVPPATSNKVAPGRTLLDRANRGPRVDVNPNATPGPLIFKPAPENSQIAVSMDKDGTIHELRIFKDHPRLARVEVVVAPNGEQSIRFTMRDGGSSVVKGKQLDDLPTTTAAQLLSIAGR